MIVVIIVFELRVDVDFVDEYVDGGYQVGVQFFGLYLVYVGVDSVVGVSSQGYQWLVVVDILCWILYWFELLLYW